MLRCIISKDWLVAATPNKSFCESKNAEHPLILATTSAKDICTRSFQRWLTGPRVRVPAGGRLALQRPKPNDNGTRMWGANSTSYDVRESWNMTGPIAGRGRRSGVRSLMPYVFAINNITHTTGATVRARSDSLQPSSGTARAT